MVKPRQVDGQFEFWLFQFVLIFGIGYANFILPAAETKRPNKFASPNERQRKRGWLFFDLGVP